VSDEPDSERVTEPAEMKPLVACFWALVSGGFGTALLLHVAGWIELDTQAGPVFLGVLGVTSLLIAGYALYLAIGNARRGGRAQDAVERARYARVTAFIGWVALLFLAFAMTTIAYYAWLPEQAGAFSGGITGSVWEMRAAWALAALVFDAIAVYALVQAWRGRGR
jgi:hypothetical protein